MENIYKPLAVLGLAASTMVGCATPQYQSAGHGSRAQSLSECHTAMEKVPSFLFFADTYHQSAKEWLNKERAQIDSASANPQDA